MRLLVVEDDPNLARLLERGLEEQAYAVDLARDGEAALTQASLNEYDAIVLDLGLPKRSGLEVASELRRRRLTTPILMLTARDTIPDRIRGLDTGADDYLTKPFDIGELFARLRALLRRAPALLPPELTVADLRIDTAAQKAERGGRAIDLTAKEFALLELLARHAGTIVTRTAITNHVWDENHDPASNAIEVYVNRLRRKVDGPGEVPLIHTRRGAGYLLGPTP